MINTNFQNFFSDVVSKENEWQKLKFGIFSKFLYHRVFIINKNFLNFFSNFGSPIFWQNLKFGIFSKFLQHRVAYDQ